MNEAIKYESFRNIRYPSMIWPFSKLVTERNEIGKTNLLANLVLEDKAEYIYKRQKGGS